MSNPARGAISTDRTYAWSMIFSDLPSPAEASS